MKNNRREFLVRSTLLGAGLIATPWFLSSCESKSGNSTTEGENAEKDASKMSPLFRISLAEWSLHRTLFDGKITNLDFPRIAKQEFGIEGVEYVNQFFKDKAKDMTYLGQLKQVCADNGVTSVLIMIDGEGDLGDLDNKVRNQAIENHYQWVEAAKYLGCHSIRVNARGEGSREEVSKAAVDGLSRLADFAKERDMNIIVENHGGMSSDGGWLSGVMKTANRPNLGTLPDFGNFCLEYTDTGCKEEYDRYKGIAELMPFAKGVSAKSHVFDAEGNESQMDYPRIMNIVKDAGYKGFVGIEYEGDDADEYKGIRQTKALLEKIFATMG